MTVLIVPDVKIKDQELIDNSAIHLLNSVLHSDFKSMAHIQSLSDRAQHGGVTKDNDAGGAGKDENETLTPSGIIPVLIDVMTGVADNLTNGSITSLRDWMNAPGKPMPGANLSRFIIKIVKYKISKLIKEIKMMIKEYGNINDGVSLDTVMDKMHTNRKIAIFLLLATSLVRSDSLEKEILKQNVSEIYKKLRNNVVMRSLINFYYAVMKGIIRKDTEDSSPDDISNEKLNEKVNSEMRAFSNRDIASFGKRVNDNALGVINPSATMEARADKIKYIFGLPENFSLDTLKNSGDFQTYFEVILPLLPIITEHITEAEYTNMAGNTPYITWNGFRSFIMDNQNYSHIKYFEDDQEADFQFDDGIKDYKPPNRKVMRGVEYKSLHIEGGKLKIQFYYFIKSTVQLMFVLADLCLLWKCVSYIRNVKGDIDNNPYMKVAGYELPIYKNSMNILIAAVDMTCTDIPKYLRRNYKLKRVQGGEYNTAIIGVISLLWNVMQNSKKINNISFGTTEMLEMFSSSANAIQFLMVVYMTYRTINNTKDIAWDMRFYMAFAKEMGDFNRNLESCIMPDVLVDLSVGTIEVPKDKRWELELSTRNAQLRLDYHIRLKKEAEDVINPLTLWKNSLAPNEKDAGSIDIELRTLNTKNVAAENEVKKTTAEHAEAKKRHDASIKKATNWLGRLTETAETQENMRNAGIKQQALNDAKEKKKNIEEMIAELNGKITKLMELDKQEKEVVKYNKEIARYEAAIMRNQKELDGLPSKAVTEQNQHVDLQKSGDNNTQQPNTKKSPSDEGGGSKESSRPPIPEDARYTENVAGVAKMVSGVLHKPVNEKLKQTTKYIAIQISKFLKKCNAFRAQVKSFRKQLYCVCIQTLLSALANLPFDALSGIRTVTSAVLDITRISLMGLKVAEKTRTVISAKTSINTKSSEEWLNYIKQYVGCNLQDRVALFLEDYFNKDSALVRRGREDRFIEASTMYLFTYSDKDTPTRLKDGVSILLDLFPTYMKFLIAGTGLTFTYLAAKSIVAIPGIVMAFTEAIINKVTLRNTGILVAIVIAANVAHKTGLFKKISDSTRSNPTLFPGQKGGAYELAIREEDMKLLAQSMGNLVKNETITLSGTSSKIEIDLMGLVDTLQLPINKEIIDILENANNKNIQDILRDIVIAGSSNTSYKRFDTDTGPDIETLNGGALYKTIIDPSTHAEYSTDSREGVRLLKKLSRVIMNTVIVDPRTGKSLCVYSKEGMNILESYMTNM